MQEKSPVFTLYHGPLHQIGRTLFSNILPVARYLLFSGHAMVASWNSGVEQYE